MIKFISSLKNIYWKNNFNPSLLGLLFNPYYFSRRTLYKNIKSNCHLFTGRMLDFGCGSKPYKNLFDVDEYIGLDFENSGHDHTNENVDCYYDGINLPFDNDYFDSFLSSQVFEHVSNLENNLQEINRVLKPNANLLITVPFVWFEHEVPIDFKRYTTFGIKQTLSNAGFEIINVKRSSNYIITIFQLWNAYIYLHVFPKNIYIKLLFNLIFIFPINLLAFVFNILLPKDNSLYLDNIIIAKKPDWVK